ncbi:MAG: carotenoid biosynthesis protein [Deltaproteobacteria bacterium]|nr:carotenoid biosynthesis protein [Deltaproteobacteria bacterium]
MRIESWQYDLVFFSFAFLILVEGRKIYGRQAAGIFLWGSLLWTGIIENINSMLGAYDYFAYANYYSFGGKPIQGYGGWISWILFVPAAACIGWFLLSMPAFMISDHLIGKRNIWLKSTFAALMLVSWDVFYDPMAVVNEWWRWTSPGFYWHGVPLGNWIGWFFLLFFFGAIYERTIIERRGFRWLSKAERLLFRSDTMDLSGMDIYRVGRVFYVRLIAHLPVFFLCVFLVAGTSTALWNNRWGPFNSVFPGVGHAQYQTAPKGVIPQQHTPLNRIGHHH